MAGQVTGPGQAGTAATRPGTARADGVPLHGAAARRLRQVIARTRLGMAAERGLHAFWPVPALLFLGFALLRLDLLASLPGPLRWPLLGALALALASALVRGVRAFRWPSRAEAVARIDDALPGRPVASLSDALALGGGDPSARAIWALHMRRVAAAAARAATVRPDLRLAARDPRALRLAALTLALAALIFGRTALTDSLEGAVPGPAQAAMDPGLVLEAWASPPGYTGRPTLYLSELPAGGTLSVPEGTVVTLRVYGEGAPVLEESVTDPAAPGALAGDPAGVREAEFAAMRDGRVAVSDGTRVLGAWSFAVIPDSPPAIRLVEPPQRTAAGAGQYVYEGRDDYGITAAWAHVAIDLTRLDRRHGLGADPEPRETIEFDLPLPVTGVSGAFTEKEIVDLALHPWAGLPVTVTLHARDAAGQVTVAAPEPVVLPGRRFYEPMAKAIVEQRRDLLWTVANGSRVARLLKAATWQPDAVFKAAKAYLVIRTAIRRLDYALAEGRLPAERDGIADLLWQAALLVEDGDLGNALERLRRAQDRLSEALENEDVSEQELAELMQELREAMEEYLEELMREALENPEQQPGDDQAEMQPQPNMSMQDLQEMLDRLQEMMRNGQREEAQALLEQLRRMMENMQMAMRPGQPGQPGPGQQMMEGLQDLLRQQQELGDRTFEELQRQLGQGRQPGRPGQPGQPGQPGDPGRPGQEPGPEAAPGTGDLSRQQEALRRLLEQFRDGMPPGLGLPRQPGEGDPVEEARRSLEEAERQMGEARDALREDDSGTAVDRQAEALDSLRDGMRSLADALREAQRRTGPEGGMEAQDRPGEQRDPLGRPTGPNGQLDSNDVRIPDGEAFKRSREIQDEIRRRAGERDRPQIELDYLRRLLDRF